MIAPALSDQRLGDLLLRSLAALQGQQLATGEMLAYRHAGDQSYHACRAPLLSALVHDALACFDPGSPYWEPWSGDAVPDGIRERFEEAVHRLRRHIRHYLAWQQESAGWWRFFGRSSGLDPDAGSTANAAAALLERPGGRSDMALGRARKAVLRFRAADGRFHSFLRDDRSPADYGYGAMDEAGRPLPGFDPVVNADVYHYLRRAGIDDPDVVGPLRRYLAGHLADEDPTTPLFPNPITFAYAVSRAWPAAERGELAALAQRVGAFQLPDGGFGDPLSTALAVEVWLTLDARGRPLERAVAALRRSAWPEGGWDHAPYLVNGYGSPAWTTAVAMRALARAAGVVN